MNSAVSAAGKNRIEPLADRLLRLLSGALRRFGCDRFNFNACFTKYRQHIGNTPGSLIKMLA
jgi:hypothetical protein